MVVSVDDIDDGAVCLWILAFSALKGTGSKYFFA